MVWSTHPTHTYTYYLVNIATLGIFFIKEMLWTTKRLTNQEIFLADESIIHLLLFK